MDSKFWPFVVGFALGRKGWPIMVHLGYLGTIALLLFKLKH